MSFITETSVVEHAPHFSMQDFKWIGTFHSVFLKMLKEDIEALSMKYDRQFGIFDTNESKTVVKDILKQL